MDASTIIALMSLAVSLGVGYKQIESDKLINKNNLEAIYFNEIYKDALVYEIPRSRQKLFVNKSGQLEGDEDLISVLKKLRLNSLYFKYTNNEFYKKLKGLLQELEDYICMSGNLIIDEPEEFYNLVNSKINSIYTCINDYYKKGK